MRLALSVALVFPCSLIAQFATFSPSAVGVGNPTINYGQRGSQAQPLAPSASPYHYSPAKENQEVLDEIREDDRKRYDADNRNTYYNSDAFRDQSKPYSTALGDMKQMLNGQKVLSVRKAYYDLESAYGNTYLSYKEYNDAINNSVQFLHRWMQEHKLNPQSNEALNYAIQEFMGDTLTILAPVADAPDKYTKVTHLPFRYDYNDFKGENDFRNYFVTKCFATGYGQCNSMPAVYLCLAEAMGAKAYLSFAPYHSFIKYPDAKGNIHNYEPTSNWHITDRWYQDNLYISTGAIHSGIYLKPMSNRKVVANCMVDLAIGYMNKFGAANGDFIKNCLSTAKTEFGATPNIYINFAYSSLMARLFYGTLRQDRADIRDTAFNPTAKHYYHELAKSETAIKALGYQEIPQQAYEQMMQDCALKNKQQEQETATKEKRTLFISK